MRPGCFRDLEGQASLVDRVLLFARATASYCNLIGQSSVDIMTDETPPVPFTAAVMDNISTSSPATQIILFLDRSLLLLFHNVLIG